MIDTHFSRLPHPLDQAVESEEYLEWVGLLKSCAAFEAYCKTYTAELRPLRVAEFLLLNEELLRLAGRLRATLSFSQIDEIIAYVDNARRQCAQIHAAIRQIYFDYPVESAMAL